MEATIVLESVSDYLLDIKCFLDEAERLILENFKKVNEDYKCKIRCDCCGSAYLYKQEIPGQYYFPKNNIREN